MSEPIELTERNIRVTSATPQPLRLVREVSRYAVLDLELAVHEGTDVEVRVLTSTDGGSEDDWIEVDRFAPTSAQGAVVKPFFPLLRYARWEVLSSGNATFSVRGVGRRRMRFVPPDIDDCVLWLRADNALTFTSGKVSNWGDRSGRGNDASQTTSTLRPTYVGEQASLGGHAALDFINDALKLADTGETALSTSTSYTLFFACDIDGTAHGDRLLDAETGLLIFFVDVSGTIQLYDGAYRDFGVAPSTGAQLLTFVLDGASSGAELYKDGASLGTVSYTGTDMSQDRTVIGARRDGGAGFFDGKIAEIAIYDRVLATTERRMVEAYMMRRYDL